MLMSVSWSLQTLTSNHKHGVLGVVRRVRHARWKSPGALGRGRTVAQGISARLT